MRGVWHAWCEGATLPIVICAPPDQAIRPPMRELVGRPNVRIVEQPMRSDELVTAVADALRWSAVDASAAQ